MWLSSVPVSLHTILQVQLALHHIPRHQISNRAQRQRTLVYLDWNDFLQFLKAIYPPPHALQLVPIDMPYLLP